MRTLHQITDAVRRGEAVTGLELRYAVCAYDVLLATMEIEQNPQQLQLFFEAAESNPRDFIGEANDPANPEAVKWHRAFINVGEPKK